MPPAILLGVSSEIDWRSIDIRSLSLLINVRIRIISATKIRSNELMVSYSLKKELIYARVTI